MPELELAQDTINILELFGADLEFQQELHFKLFVCFSSIFFKNWIIHFPMKHIQ